MARANGNSYSYHGIEITGERSSGFPREVFAGTEILQIAGARDNGGERCMKPNM